MPKLNNFLELLDFVKKENRWFLLPILFVLVTLGAMLVFVQGSTLAPFIYALF